ncbi:MAG: hypothetical protein ABIW80_12640, partial [Lapillicoccus sp.]
MSDDTTTQTHDSTDATDAADGLAEEPLETYAGLPGTAETVHTIDPDAPGHIESHSESHLDDATGEVTGDGAFADAPVDPVEEYKRQLRMKDGDWYVVH